jgi:hypothetical protein
MIILQNNVMLHSLTLKFKMADFVYGFFVERQKIKTNLSNLEIQNGSQTLKRFYRLNFVKYKNKKNIF